MNAELCYIAALILGCESALCLATRPMSGRRWALYAVGSAFFSVLGLVLRHR